MIAEILIMLIIDLDKDYIKIDFEKFINLNDLIAEKIVKKIYRFFYDENFFLRSKKIVTFIKEIHSFTFKTFKLGKIIIKKRGDSLIFFKISN